MALTDLFGNPLRPLGQEMQPGDQTPDFVNQILEVGEVEAVAAVRRPLNGLTFWILGVTAILAGQCFRLQIIQGSVNQAKAANNSLRVVTVQPDRGLIVDNLGNPLAQNTRRLALSINPQTLPASRAGREVLYAKLKEQAQIDSTTIAFIEKNRLATPDPFAIKMNLTEEQSLLYKEWFANTPGILLPDVPIREYANLPSLGQLIGYVGQANTEADAVKNYTPDQRIGRTGLEQSYDRNLLGTAGKEKAEVNAQGEIVRKLADTGDAQAKPGTTLKLSLDSQLQLIVATALDKAIQQRTQIYGTALTGSLGASAVFLDPKDGSIKSMVSLPDYNANLFSSGISQSDYQQLLANPANPLLNRAIQGLYPSGSTIKPLVAAAALQAGIIDPNRIVTTPEAIYIGQFRFPDWKAHGQTTLRQAIAQSNDIYFYAVGGGWADQHIGGLGIDRLNQGLSAFGLGTKTGIDLPGEAAGLVAGPDWKQKNNGESWYIGDTYHQSIGQGYLLATPLQMAMATAAIANGGTLYKPQLGWSMTDPVSGQESLLPHTVLNKQWISSTNIQTVQQGMEQTTQPGGTAQLMGKLKITSAAKTGTAQFGNDNLTHSWYVGYAPVNNPKIAFAVLIEGDGDVSEATEGSEPVVEEILRGYFNEPLQPGGQLFTQALLPQAPSKQAPKP